MYIYLVGENYICETDLYGHVNNTSYRLYFEQGRADYLEHLGFYNNQFNFFFVVGDFYCRYHQEAYALEHLLIKVRIAHRGTKSIKIESVIQRKSNLEVVATSWATLIIVDKESKKSIPIPKLVHERVDKLENLNVLNQ